MKSFPDNCSEEIGVFQLREQQFTTFTRWFWWQKASSFLHEFCFRFPMKLYYLWRNKWKQTSKALERDLTPPSVRSIKNRELFQGGAQPNKSKWSEIRMNMDLWSILVWCVNIEYTLSNFVNLLWKCYSIYFTIVYVLYWFKILLWYSNTYADTEWMWSSKYHTIFCRCCSTVLCVRVCYLKRPLPPQTCPWWDTNGSKLTFMFVQEFSKVSANDFFGNEVQKIKLHNF